MIKPWKLLKSEWALNEKWYKVRRDTVEIKPGKIIDDYFLAVFEDIVIILAITPDGQVPLVRQYKHGAGEIIAELPAGYIDKGETDPLVAAKRELQEETGFTSDDWEHLGYFYKNSTKAEGNNVHIYLANDAQKTAEQNLDENEDIEVILKPFSEALQMAKSGELKGIDTVLALMLVVEKIDAAKS